MKQERDQKTRGRIITASTKLFSLNGYDATSVNQIASSAGVTKALIYYYFKSKEDILDSLVSSLLEDTTSMAMDFIHENIVQVINEGSLDIEPDKLHFASIEARGNFMNNVYAYHEQFLDYALANREVLRILMLESLKKSKHHTALFRFINLMQESYENPIFKTIHEADRDFNCSNEMILFNFFFCLIPIFNFAAYYDNCKSICGMPDKELRESFLNSLKHLTDSLISGSDILLRNISPPK